MPWTQGLNVSFYSARGSRVEKKSMKDWSISETSLIPVSANASTSVSHPHSKAHQQRLSLILSKRESKTKRDRDRMKIT
jgi:hypothetical protein